MAIRFVSAGTASNSGGTPAPGLPAGWAENDIFILIVETANQSMAAPSGWTQFDDSLAAVGTAGATDATRIQAYYRRATASESAPTLSDSGDHTFTRIYAFRGCKLTGSPINVVAGDADNASEISAIPLPGVTTTVADCYVVMVAAWANDVSSNDAVYWKHTGLLDVEVFDGTGSTLGNGGGFNIAGGEKAAAGATGDGEQFFSAATEWAALTFALEPETDTGASAEASKVTFGFVLGSISTTFDASKVTLGVILDESPPPAPSDGYSDIIVI